MSTAADAAGLELVEAAEAVVSRYASGDRHTVAAAARAADGRIVTGMNVYHFTGGPCAELTVIGAAAGQGAYDLVTMVAVADGERGVIPPCGRCRQVLADCFPDIRVIVGAPGGPRSVGIAELLPAPYDWAAARE